MTQPSYTPIAPVLTITHPAPNLVVGLNTPFQITGQVTDRGMPEPISVDSVTVQVNGGPLIRASLRYIRNKTLTQVAFTATAEVTSGNGPHTLTVVATNDLGQTTTKTVTVFTGVAYQVDSPALLLDLLTIIPIEANDPQVLGLLGKIQTQLLPLSQQLVAAGKVLIGPNILVQPVNSVESRVRLGLWIEDPSFPVVPPSAAFPLPRLPDVAANAALSAAPLLTLPDVGIFPSYGISIPATTLQHLLDTVVPALIAGAADQDLTVQSITVQTSSPNLVTTSISGHLPLGVPVSLSIQETIGLKAVADATSPQMSPAVLSTSSSASVGSLLDWLIGSFFPLIGATLGYILYKVSTGASDQSGLAGSLLGSIPPRIPFGNQAFTLPASLPYQLPDFPALVFYWNSFNATSAGLVGSGNTQIEARTESIVKVSVGGPTFFRGTQESIVELVDPVLNDALENISPDNGRFNWQIAGYPNSKGSIPLPSPLAQAGEFNPSFPLPLHVQPTTYKFSIVVNAVETCESDASKTLTGTGSLSVTYQVAKSPILLTE